MTAKLHEVQDAGWSLDPLTGGVFCFLVLCKIRFYYYYFFPMAIGADVFCKDPERELAGACRPPSRAGRQPP